MSNAIKITTNDRKITLTNLYAIKCSELMMALRETHKKINKDPSFITLIHINQPTLRAILEWTEHYTMGPSLTNDIENMQYEITEFDEKYLIKHGNQWRELRQAAYELYITPLVKLFDMAMERERERRRRQGLEARFRRAQQQRQRQANLIRVKSVLLSAADEKQAISTLTSQNKIKSNELRKPVQVIIAGDEEQIENVVKNKWQKFAGAAVKNLAAYNQKVNKVMPRIHKVVAALTATTQKLTSSTTSATSKAKPKAQTSATATKSASRVSFPRTSKTKLSKPIPQKSTSTLTSSTAINAKNQSFQSLIKKQTIPSSNSASMAKQAATPQNNLPVKTQSQRRRVRVFYKEKVKRPRFNPIPPAKKPEVYKPKIIIKTQMAEIVTPSVPSLKK